MRVARYSIPPYRAVSSSLALPSTHPLVCSTVSYDQESVITLSTRGFLPANRLPFGSVLAFPVTKALFLFMGSWTLLEKPTRTGQKPSPCALKSGPPNLLKNRRKGSSFLGGCKAPLFPLSSNGGTSVFWLPS